MMCSQANQLHMCCSDRIELHTMSMPLCFVSECKGLNGRFDVYFEYITDDNNAYRALETKFLLSVNIFKFVLTF